MQARSRRAGQSVYWWINRLATLAVRRFGKPHAHPAAPLPGGDPGLLDQEGLVRLRSPLIAPQRAGPQGVLPTWWRKK